MVAANASFDALATTTLQNYRKTLIDNVFNDRPLLSFLSRKDKITTESSPGRSIVQPLRTGKNTTVKSYSTYDTLDITPQEGISAAEFPWRSLVASIAISGEEEDKNTGDAAVLSLLQAKVGQAEDSLSDGLSVMLYSDGSGNSGKDFDGLLKAISTTAPWGGIDPTTSQGAFWQSKVTAVGGALDVSKWTHSYYLASKGNDSPDFCITDQNLFEKYEATLVPGIRYTSTDAADARFQVLNFKGVRVYFDLACPTGSTYFLNSKYLGIVGMSKRWFDMGPWKNAPDKDARYSQIITRGNLVSSNRSRQAVLTGQT